MIPLPSSLLICFYFKCEATLCDPRRDLSYYLYVSLTCIKVTLNKKSKKSTFMSTQKSTLLKKVLFEYSKKYFLSTQKSTLLKKKYSKKYFCEQNGSTKYFFKYLKKYFCSKKYFLSTQKSTLLKKVLKKGLKKVLLLKKVAVLEKVLFSSKINIFKKKNTCI